MLVRLKFGSREEQFLENPLLLKKNKISDTKINEELRNGADRHQLLV